MGTIYVSSTYEDLEEHWEAVYHPLRRWGHNVQAMEDDEAADERPVDRCLHHVATPVLTQPIHRQKAGVLKEPRRAS